jgi:hypothetical protein
MSGRKQMRERVSIIAQIIQMPPTDYVIRVEYEDGDGRRTLCNLVATVV